MGAFIKGFLLEDPRRLMGTQGIQLFLGAFGKHPGWDDHIEDIGLDTESLVAAKQNLYVNGIGRQIDSAAWDKLGEADALGAFKHNFLWSRGGQFVIGRMWSSSDGKGRTRYPMVVACHCVQVPLAPATRKILPLLLQLELACKRVKTAADVRSAIAQSLNQLRFAICDLGSDLQQPATLADSERKVLDAIGSGAREEGLLRVMYQVQTHMNAFSRGRFSVKADDASLRPQHIRVPAAADNPVDSLLIWNRIFDSALDPASPRLFLIPDGEGWLDVIVGEPSEQEFFCLRAAPKAMPLASEVPYNLEPGFRERTQKFFTDLRDGKIAPQPASSTLRQSTTSFTQRWFKGGKKWFGAASLLSVCAVGVLGWWAFTRKEPAAVGRNVPAEPSASAVATIATQPPPQQPPPPPPVAAEVTTRPTPPPAPEPKPIVASQPILVTAAPVEPPPPVTPPPAVVEKPPAKAPAQLAAVSAAAPARPTQAREPPETTTPNVRSPAFKRENLTNVIGMELVWLTNGFWAGRFEVTQGEYSKVMGGNPSKFKGNPRSPVENVSWHDAVNFCKKLTTLDHEAKSIPATAYYTLPTEQQWEAIRGKARLHSAITSQTMERKSTVAVTNSGANQFGLFGVLGNVWEWCLEDAALKTLRGAAYNSPRTQDFEPITETTALKLAPDAKFPHTGFRCVLIPSE